MTSASVPMIERGGAGLRNIERLGDQPLNLPPVFRNDAVQTSIHCRVGQHHMVVQSDLMPGSASAMTSVGRVEMYFDARGRRRGQWTNATFDLNGSEVTFFRGDLKFADDEPQSAIVYRDDGYGANTYSFYAVLPFSRMAPMVQILGGYPDSFPSMSFDLETAGDDVSVINFHLGSRMREDDG